MKQQSTHSTSNTKSRSQKGILDDFKLFYEELPVHNAQPATSSKNRLVRRSRAAQ